MRKEFLDLSCSQENNNNNNNNNNSISCNNVNNRWNRVLLYFVDYLVVAVLKPLV